MNPLRTGRNGKPIIANIDRLHRLMDRDGLAAVVVRGGQNVSYLAGISFHGTLARHLDLPDSVRDSAASAREFTIPPHRTLAEIERMAILQTLQRTNWNKQEAAQILGLYRPTLYSKMKKHEIRDNRASRREAAQR